MSVQYQPVGWTRFKMLYDAVLLGGIAAYLLVYLRLGPRLSDATLGRDVPTRMMAGYGTCAFILLSIALCIGPLARLDQRFLPLLYNRRHLGVMTAVVATGHAWAVLDWYFVYSRTPPLLAVLVADTGSGHLHGLPFIPFGLFALLVLWVLAATSHDFWLAFLGPPLWKALHLLIYAAYAAAVLHLGLGALQDVREPMLPLLAAASVACVCGLHLAAGLRERRRGRAAVHDGWVAVGPADGIANGRAVVVAVPGGEVAVFRDGRTISAIANLCAHQNGPLGEGRVIDGCVVCPWHGYQYRLGDGCSPPPFTERVSTYRLRLENGVVMLDPRPNPPGTAVPPVML
jgi:nitrite reductase/ring-hydroxylating ferredoxin subunit/DMSO/TMAO reductase YedYZ heme-binding membrane subunit